MIKNIAIVSLSRGVAGEAFAQHEVEIGLKRLAGYGVNVQFMPNARRGIDYLTAHPEARAADLLQAFRDPGIDMILCAIGGDDTYRLLPYLFDHDELRRAVTGKVFLGFSDTTVNHMMLHKVGLPTFYGQAFLPDVCELGPAMLPYTERYFAELLRTGTIRAVTPSDVWYESRTDFSPSQIGIAPAAHPDDGFQLLQGSPTFSGEILGGCIDTFYDFFDGTRYADMPLLCQKIRPFSHGRGLAGENFAAGNQRGADAARKIPRGFDASQKRRGVPCRQRRADWQTDGPPMRGRVQAAFGRGHRRPGAACRLQPQHRACRATVYSTLGVRARVDVAAQKITFA